MPYQGHFLKTPLYLFITALRVLDKYSSFSTTASALIHEQDYIDIYSNSWGYEGNGKGFWPLYKVEEAALLQGVTEV